jgi:hypothetical protein
MSACLDLSVASIIFFFLQSDGTPRKPLGFRKCQLNEFEKQFLGVRDVQKDDESEKTLRCEISPETSNEDNFHTCEDTDSTVSVSDFWTCDVDFWT